MTAPLGTRGTLAAHACMSHSASDLQDFRLRAAMRYLMLPAVLGLLIPARPAAGQAYLAKHTTSHAPGVPVAMLNIALYNDRANLREPTDSAKAILATEKLRDTLARSAGVNLIDSASVAAAESSPEALAAAANRPCNVIVACARAVGRRLGAPWVVMGKLSKTSNLIWTFSGQLINVKTGELVIDDTFELKGDPDQMVPPGMGIFAQRVSRRVSGQPAA
jgi:uncharacterized protein DUF2380